MNESSSPSYSYKQMVKLVQEQNPVYSFLKEIVETEPSVDLATICYQHLLQLVVATAQTLVPLD